jgi:hypothetical protein
LRGGDLPPSNVSPINESGCEYVLSVDDVKLAMQRMADAPRQTRCPPHLVHPEYAHHRYARDTDRDVTWVGCANLCGTLLPLVEPTAEVQTTIISEHEAVAAATRQLGIARAKEQT